ncbi:MAG: hypothetical protein ABI939_08655 [Anaerolineaceae bacterium]
MRTAPEELLALAIELEPDDRGMVAFGRVRGIPVEAVVSELRARMAKNRL